jgi:hypothetical protein
MSHIDPDDAVSTFNCEIATSYEEARKEFTGEYLGLKPKF